MAQAIANQHPTQRRRDTGGDKGGIDRDMGLSKEKWVAALDMIGRAAEPALFNPSSPIPIAKTE